MNRRNFLKNSLLASLGAVFSSTFSKPLNTSLNNITIKNKMHTDYQHMLEFINIG